MSAHILEPVDSCGCGDTGYLTTRTLPIDLAHGTGKINNVPVYHCRDEQCKLYTLPESVSRRLEEIAEEMEEKHSLEEAFTWPRTAQDPAPLDPAKQSNTSASVAQAFTLQLFNREYEDGKVLFVFPGEAVVIKSNLDEEEYYLLRYTPDSSPEPIRFTFSKFYSDRPLQRLEDIIALEEEGGLKELAILRLEDIEDALSDEFGDIL